MEHQQRLLYINPPTLPHSSQVPEGFLGYAVNLIYLLPDLVQVKVDTRIEKYVGLRESLWFHLLGRLQVYDTAKNMLLAKNHLQTLDGGAISLDGGQIKANVYQEPGRLR
jgi:hypothetical protein